MDIKKEELEVIDNLMSKKVLLPTEIGLLESTIRKWIDKHMVVCKHCPAQIRMAHKRLRNWYMKQSFNIIDSYDDFTSDELFNFELETTELEDNIEAVEVVVLEEPKKKGRPCSKCKQKTDGSNKTKTTTSK